MKNKFLKGVVASFALALSGLANAGLIVQDFDSVGDGYITFDTDTNLQWLDLSLTDAARSYNDVVNGVNGRDFYSEGFRHATYSELFTLFTNAGVPNLNIGWHTSNFAGVSLLQSLGILQPNRSQDGGNWEVWYNDSEDPTGSSSYTRFVHSNISSSMGWLGIGKFCNTSGGIICNPTGQLVGSKGLAYSHRAHYLVRATEVPEPSTLAIFALGVMGLASRKFNKQV